MTPAAHVALINDLVEAFGCGSQARLAGILGVTRQDVTNWKQRGLPAWRRDRIELKAREMGVKLPHSFEAGAG